MRVLDLAPLPEQRVGFVEKQHRVRIFGGLEHPVEILLRLADPLRHHPGQVDPKERQPQFGRNDAGGHGLAGAGGPGEEGGRPGTADRHFCESPAIEDGGAAANCGTQLLQLREGISR